jgi:Holliday junction resolvasome RuvABC endonuclease subunit
MMGRILAIDPSGRGTGIADGCPGQDPFLETVVFATDPDRDGPVEIFGRASSYFLRRLQQTKPELIAIEQPLMLHNPMIVCGLYAIIIGQARAHGVRVLTVTVRTWRKFFLGRGTLPGAQAKAEALRVCKALRWKPPDHNSAEAAGIWLYACSQRAPKLAQQPEPLFTGVIR